jgi:hypothetical protein
MPSLARRSFPCTWCHGTPGTLDHWLFTCPGMHEIQAPAHIRDWAQQQPPCTRLCGLATEHTDVTNLIQWHDALASLVIRLATRWRHENPDHPTQANADAIEAWCQACEEQGAFPQTRIADELPPDDTIVPRFLWESRKRHKGNSMGIRAMAFRNKRVLPGGQLPATKRAKLAPTRISKPARLQGGALTHNFPPPFVPAPHPCPIPENQWPLGVKKSNIMQIELPSLLFDKLAEEATANEDWTAQSRHTFAARCTSMVPRSTADCYELKLRNDTVLTLVLPHGYRPGHPRPTIEAYLWCVNIRPLRQATSEFLALTTNMP